MCKTVTALPAGGDDLILWLGGTVTVHTMLLDGRAARRPQIGRDDRGPLTARCCVFAPHDCGTPMTARCSAFGRHCCPGSGLPFEPAPLAGGGIEFQIQFRVIVPVTANFNLNVRHTRAPAPARRLDVQIQIQFRLIMPIHPPSPHRPGTRRSRSRAGPCPVPPTYCSNYSLTAASGQTRSTVLLTRTHCQPGRDVTSIMMSESVPRRGTPAHGPPSPARPSL